MKSQHAGGMLLPPVQKLVATLINRIDRGTYRHFKFSFIGPLRAAPLAPYDEGAAERSEAGGEKNVLSSLPQSKIGPKVPIFASSLTEGAKAAFGGKRNDKSQFVAQKAAHFGRP